MQRGIGQLSIDPLHVILLSTQMRNRARGNRDVCCFFASRVAFEGLIPHLDIIEEPIAFPRESRSIFGMNPHGRQFRFGEGQFLVQKLRPTRDRAELLECASRVVVPVPAWQPDRAPGRSLKSSRLVPSRGGSYNLSGFDLGAASNLKRENPR
jgi:hypothetical protein